MGDIIILQVHNQGIKL